jgi:hypothetical protein
MAMGRASSRTIRVLPVACAVAFLAAASAFAKPPVDPQQPPDDAPASGVLQPLAPGQIQGSATPRLDGVGPFQRLPAQDESGFVILETRKTAWWRAGLHDPVLTDACRLGDFASVPLNRMVVRFEAPEGEGALQVILPDRRHLLVDKRNLAAPGETYYFKDASYPTCEVYVGNPARPLRRLAKGTSLPPSDPKALQKRLAEIKSWPQK